MSERTVEKGYGWLWFLLWFIWLSFAFFPEELGEKAGNLVKAYKAVLETPQKGQGDE